MGEGRLGKQRVGSRVEAFLAPSLLIGSVRKGGVGEKEMESSGFPTGHRLLFSCGGSDGGEGGIGDGGVRIPAIVEFCSYRGCSLSGESMGVSAHRE